MPGVLPDALQRRRILRMWARHRRQPARSRALPRCWRRDLRLAFWWQLAILVQDEPWLVILAMASVPAWLMMLFFEHR